MGFAFLFFAMCGIVFVQTRDQIFPGIAVLKDGYEIGANFISAMKQVVSEIKFIQMDDEYVVAKKEQFWLRNFYITNLKMSPSVNESGADLQCIQGQYCYVAFKKKNLQISGSISLHWAHYVMGQEFKSGTFSCQIDSDLSNITIVFSNGTQIPVINITNSWVLSNIDIKGRGSSQELKQSIALKIQNYNGLVITDLIKNFQELYSASIIYSNKLNSIQINIDNYPNQYYIQNQFLYFLTGQDSSYPFLIGFAFNSTLISKTTQKALPIIKSINNIKYQTFFSEVFGIPIDLVNDIVNFVITDNQINYKLSINETQLKSIYNYDVKIRSLSYIYSYYLAFFDVDETFNIQCNFPSSPATFLNNTLYMNASCAFITSNTKKQILTLNIQFSNSLSFGLSQADPNLGLTTSVRLNSLHWESFKVDIPSTKRENALFYSWLQPLFKLIPTKSINMIFYSFPYEEVKGCKQLITDEDNGILYSIGNACNLF